MGFMRSSHQRCSVPATLLKKRFWHRCFPVNFAKFSRTAFLYRTSQVAASDLCNISEIHRIPFQKRKQILKSFAYLAVLAFFVD